MDLDNSVDFKDAVAGEDFGEEIDGEASDESASRGCNARADLERSVDLRDEGGDSFDKRTGNICLDHKSSILSSALTPLSMSR